MMVLLDLHCQTTLPSIHIKQTVPVNTPLDTEIIRLKIRVCVQNYGFILGPWCISKYLLHNNCRWQVGNKILIIKYWKIPFTYSLD